MLLVQALALNTPLVAAPVLTARLCPLGAHDRSSALRSLLRLRSYARLSSTFFSGIEMVEAGRFELPSETAMHNDRYMLFSLRRCGVLRYERRTAGTRYEREYVVALCAYGCRGDLRDALHVSACTLSSDSPVETCTPPEIGWRRLAYVQHCDSLNRVASDLGYSSEDGAETWNRTTLSRSSGVRYNHTSSLCKTGAAFGDRTRHLLLTRQACLLQHLCGMVDAAGIEPASGCRHARPLIRRPEKPSSPRHSKMVGPLRFELRTSANQAEVIPFHQGPNGPPPEIRTLTTTVKSRVCNHNTCRGWLLGLDSNQHLTD